MKSAKPCPFCGHSIDPNDIDTLYPSGTGWIDHHTDAFRSYVSAYEVPKEQWCYKIICNESYGGCGAEVHGDSIDETLDKWNTRYTDWDNWKPNKDIA